MDDLFFKFIQAEEEKSASVFTDPPPPPISFADSLGWCSNGGRSSCSRGGGDRGATVITWSNFELFFRKILYAVMRPVKKRKSERDRCGRRQVMAGYTISIPRILPPPPRRAAQGKWRH